MKTRNIVKKFFALAAAAAMTFTLCACSNGAAQETARSQSGESQNVEDAQSPESQNPDAQQPAGGATYKIGICNYVDDASLN